MKKIGLIILLTLSFLLLTNCNKDKKKETVAVEYENKNPKIKFSDDTYKLFEKFAENKKDIMQKLKTLNKDEANKLYEEYVEDNEDILYKIGEATEKFLDSIYYGSEEEQFTEKDWNDTNKILNKFPNSKLKIKVIALLNSYREDYILGMDNTPTIDGGYDNVPITIYEEAEKEFNRFMKKYPNSPTVELIRYFLKNYKNDNIYELIRCKIIEKFEKDPFVDVLSENLGKMMAIERNYEKYILKDKEWEVDIDNGYIYSDKEKYPIQIIGHSILNKDEGSTWVWAWKNSDVFNGDLLSLAYNVHGIGMDLKLCTFINSKFKITDEINENILSAIACGISGENLAFDNIYYSLNSMVIYYAIKDLPNEVFSSVNLSEFVDITSSCTDKHTLNEKLFVESFLKWNKTKYEWQGNKIIADFGKDGKLEIEFEKIGDKYKIKKILV